MLVAPVRMQKAWPEFRRRQQPTRHFVTVSSHVISTRASNIFGPARRHRISQKTFRKASRATRPGPVVAAMRILCTGVCTSRRFHRVAEEHEGFCRLGCVSQLDCLRHYNPCPRLAAILSAIWRHADSVIHPHAPLYDVLTRVTCRCDQHCVLALGFVDAFVYAYHHQRHNRDAPVPFVDCTQVRIRLMTTLAPTCAGVYQHFCVGRGLRPAVSQALILEAGASSRMEGFALLTRIARRDGAPSPVRRQASST